MRFQAKLTTKLDEFSIGDAIVELSNNVDSKELDDIVKSFLKQLDKYDENKLGDRSFDFLVGGRLLRLNAEEHLKLYSDEIDASEILNEKLVEVEYLLALEPPKPLEALKQDDWVSCVDANDAYIITGSYDNTIRIYTINDRTLVQTVKDAHEKPVSKVKFVTTTNQATTRKNEIYFISCGHDEVSILRKLNLKTKKVTTVFTYSGHNRSVNCIDTCDDLIATGSFDKTLRLWSAGSEDQENTNDDNEIVSTKSVKKQKTRMNEKSIGGTSRSAIMTLTGHQDSITGVKWLGDCNEYKSVASCSMDRSICIWDIEVGDCKWRVHANKPLLGIDFCPERKIFISASCDRFVRVWDARAPDNASAKAAYISHTAWVSSVFFGQSSTNHFVSGGYDNLVKLWDLRSPKACLYDLIGHHDKVLEVNWSNPSYVISGSADSTLKVFATKDQR